MISYVVSRTIMELQIEAGIDQSPFLLANLPMATDFLLNIITAILLRRDIKRYNITTRYVMLATILYGPLGVFAFLVYVLLLDKALTTK